MVQPQAARQRADILVVDDTPANLRLLSELLGQHGYKVRPATNGAQALAAVLAELPDLILLDVRMAGIDGYAICERLKADARTHDIPVIFLSALDEVLDKVRAFAVGGADYITKPFQFEEVLARIETHLSLRRLHLQQQAQNAQLLAENAARKELAERLERGNALLRAQHEASIDAILVVDEHGYLSYYNQNFIDLWPVPPAVIAARRERELVAFLAPLFAPPEDLEATLRRLSEHAAEVRREEVVLKDGRIIDRHTAPIMAPGGEHHGRVWHFRDITARKQMERELTRAYEHVKLLNNRLQDELDLARDIQQRLLAPAKPAWPALDVMCYTHPAHEIGGDFYDYHAAPGAGIYGLALGDASGKGMPAALLMAISLAAFQISVKGELPPADLLAQLDATIMDITRTSQQNCALVYLAIDPAAGRLSAANAGGVTPLLKTRDGTLRWLNVSGMPLGIGVGAETRYMQEDCPVAAGDMVVMLSDGVVEARDPAGEMYGFERFERSVRQAPQSSAAAMLAHLTTDVLAFVRDTELYDDMTLIVVRL